MKRYEIICEGVCERHDDLDEHGDWVKADEALARIAELERERDEHEAERTRLVMLRAVDEKRIAELKGLLRDLVEEIDDRESFRAPLHRSNCPECEEYPDELVIVCPYHAAKAALGGEK